MPLTKNKVVNHGADKWLSEPGHEQMTAQGAVQAQRPFAAQTDAANHDSFPSASVGKLCAAGCFLRQ